MARSYKRFLEEVILLQNKESRRADLNKKETIFSIDRFFLKNAVNEHSALLKSKFPDINLKDVTNSTHIIFKNNMSKHIGKFGVQWANKNRNEVIAPNIRALQRFLVQVKNSIRQEAVQSINESKKALIKEEKVQASIVITGIDPRLKSEGGDLTSKNLEDGKVVVNNDKNLKSLSRTRGIQIGHTFGPSIINISNFADNQEILALFEPSDRKELIKLKKIALNKSAILKVNLNLLKSTNKNIGEINLTVAQTNNKLNSVNLDEEVKRLKKIVEKRADDLLTAYGSPLSIQQTYEQGITQLFLTGNIGKLNSVINKTFKKNKRISKQVQKFGPDLKSNKQRPRKNKTANITNVQNIIDLVNRKLHDQIRKNMGKGNSQQVLNYRTGRFARSAKLKNLIASKEKNALVADVEYQDRPYSVFEKGGRLFKPGRDPKRIFGTSIRQILQEEKIASLRRVKVNLHGQ